MRPFFLLFLAFLAACETKDKQSLNEKPYFEVERFFKAKAEYLAKIDPAIEKTVSQNNNKQKKTLHISDWASELELFSASGINKPAWKDSYQVVRRKNITEYIATDPNLRTQKISIATSGSREIKHIFIYNKTSNALYTSTEELNYYPDSMYSVRKHQKVLVIGTNTYFISGKFKN